MHSSLKHLSHRPWPLSKGPWVLRQSWLDLLFAHWPVPVEQVRRLVPAGLEVDQFDGTSWVGVIPFRMKEVVPRALPALPQFSEFPELNVRVYVRHGGKPGIWFLSLDAASALAVWGARRFVHLPYWRAEMSIASNANGAFDYRSERIGALPPVRFSGTYRATSHCYHAAAGSLEEFLVERYCLYAQSPAGKLYRTEVHHAPWPLQRAEAELDAQELLTPHGLCIPAVPPLLHFSRRLDVVTWLPAPL